MWIIQVRGQARDRCRPVCHPDVRSKLMKRNVQLDQVGGIGAATFGKEVFAFLMMNEIVCYCVLLFVHREKKYNTFSILRLAVLP